MKANLSDQAGLRSRWRWRTAIVLAWLVIGVVVNGAVAWASVWYAESLDTINKRDSIGQGLAWPFHVHPCWDKPLYRVTSWTDVYERDYARYVQWTNLDGHGDASTPGWRSTGQYIAYVCMQGQVDFSYQFDLEIYGSVHVNYFDGMTSALLREAFWTRAGWPLPALQSRFTQTLDSKSPGLTTGAVYNGPHMNPAFRRTIFDLYEGGLTADSILPASAWGRRMWTFPIMPVWPGFVVNSLFYSFGGWCLVRGLLWLRSWVVARLRRKQSLCPGCGYASAGLATCPECGGVATARGSLGHGGGHVSGASADTNSMHDADKAVPAGRKVFRLVNLAVFMTCVCMLAMFIRRHYVTIPSLSAPPGGLSPMRVPAAMRDAHKLHWSEH